MTRPMSDMTAYARANVRQKRSNAKREKNLGMRAVANAVGKCGANKRDGSGKCGLPKGHGTDHPGIGPCRFHGGGLPTVKLNAAGQAARFMGAEKDMHPLDAIMWCIRITAGEVEWLSNQIGEINDKEEWYEHTVIGKQMNILVRERSQAQERLVNFSKIAISLGLEERAVRIAEQYGNSLARLIRGILEDLKLNTAQKKAAPHIIRRHLIMLEANQRPIEVEPRVAIPARVVIDQ